MELLPLVCLCLLSCSGDAVRVVVEEDSDAVLPCLISTKEDISGKYFDWKKDGQTEVFLYDAGVHYNNGRQGQDDQFKGRVSFFQDQLENGDASIKITRTKMADSGTYSCDFPRHQPRQTSIIELVVGAASKPYVTTVKTDDGVMLQCEVLGASPRPKVEWKDRSGNVLQAEEPQVTERGGRYDIVLRAAVTKTDTFRCVVNQEEIGHQTEADIYVVNGAASKPYVTTIKTDKGVMLQCEVLGAFPKPKVEWKDSSGNTLPVKEVNETEKGDLFYIILRADVTKTDTFRCVVNQEEIGHQTEAEIYVVNDPVLKGRTVENIPGAAPKPNIDILKMTKNWILLQCEARGVSPLTVEWKNGAGNILKSESTPKSETGSPSSITLNITVTKTDDYSCVATQKEFSHEIAAVIPVYIQGSNTGWIVGGIVCGAALIIIVLVLVIIRLDRKLRKEDQDVWDFVHCKYVLLPADKKKSDAVELNSTDQNNRITEPLKPDP